MSEELEELEELEEVRFAFKRKSEECEALKAELAQAVAERDALRVKQKDFQRIVEIVTALRDVEPS